MATLHLTELPNPETHLQLFYKYKRKNEILGLAEISRTQIAFNTDVLEEEIESYFTEGINMKPEQFDWGKLRHKSESYIKAVYLADDYNKNGFKNPVGAHWNPRINKYQIHPGRDRAKILDLFGAEKINCIAFNTGGKKLTYIKQFDTPEAIRQHLGKSKWQLYVTADHNSIIPHVFIDWFDEKGDVDSQQVPARMQTTFSHLKKFWFDHNVKHNFDTLSTKYVNWIQGPKTINMIAKNRRGMFKAWILAPYVTKHYKDNDVEIYQ